MINKMWRRATIQERSVTRVKGVKTDNGWTTVETVYCSLRPLTSAELRIADQNGEIVSHEVWMRYRDDLGTGDVELTPDFKLVIDSQDFEIRSVENVDFRNEWYRLRVEERV